MSLSYVLDVVREFWGQLYAFVVKNALIFRRARMWHLVLVSMPVVAITVLGVLERSENAQPDIVAREQPFFTLNSSSAITCRVFDSLSGNLGLGIPISDAWCTPMLFAPTTNKGVTDVMDIVAQRKGWRSRLIPGESKQLESTAQPDECEANKCMLGFESSTDLSTWLAANPGRAATAIVFRERTNSSNAPLEDLSRSKIPNEVLFEIWYNDTALDFYAAEGDNVLAGDGTMHEQLVVAQHAVEEALLAHKLEVEEAESTMHFKRYPLLEKKDFTDWTARWGHMFILVVLAMPAVMVYNQIVREKASGTFGAMRQAGMHEGAWWLAFIFQSALIVFCTVCVMTVVGYPFRITIFSQVDFAVLLGMCWLYGMALLAQAFLIASVTSNASMSRYLLFICLVGQGVLAVLMEDDIILVFDPTRVHRIVPNVVQLNAIMAFAKVMYDVTHVVRRVPTIGYVAGEERNVTMWVPRDRYELDHLYRGNYTGQLRTLNIGEFFVSPPTIEAVGWMAVSLALCTLTAWYITHTLTQNQGRVQRLWFLLNPRFWWPPSVLNGNEALLRYELEERYASKKASDYNSDVWREIERVLSDSIPSGHNVVMYDLSKRFGRKTVVNGVSMALADNEIFALLGHNGAGKTTLINLITGYLRPSDGDALIYGASLLHDLYEVRRMVGHCPQYDRLFDDITPQEHLYLFGRIRGVLSADLAQEIPDILVDMRLADVKDQLTVKLSGGMKRRLSVAIAYIGAPQLVVLDEPTTGMDPYNRAFVWEMIEGSRRGRTTLLTTHLMEEADALGNTLGILSRGQLVALGTSVYLKGRFGSGYSIKLVTKSAHAAALKAKVEELLPSATLLDDSAGSCTYTISNEDIRSAGPLLAYIESLQKKRFFKRRGKNEPRLTDWIITRSTLEDVFMSLRADTSQEDRLADVADNAPAVEGGPFGTFDPQAVAHLPNLRFSPRPFDLVQRLRSPEPARAPPPADAAKEGPRESTDTSVVSSASDSTPSQGGSLGAPPRPPPRRGKPPALAPGGREYLGTHAGGTQHTLASHGELAARPPPRTPPRAASSSSALVSVEHGAEGSAGAVEASRGPRLGGDVGGARRRSADVGVSTAGLLMASSSPGVQPEDPSKARPWRATALKNVTTLRRSPAMLCCSMFMPLLIGFLLFAYQDLVVDESAAQFEYENRVLLEHVTEACGRIEAAYDTACERGDSLAKMDACEFCATIDWTQYSRCCANPNATFSANETDPCVATYGEGVRTANQCLRTGSTSHIDFSDCLDGNGTLADDASDFCTCTDGKGGRSGALRAQIDRTPMCREFNRVLKGRLTEDQVDWVPSDLSPDALDTQLPEPARAAGREALELLSWLGWRVPVFANASGVRSTFGNIRSSQLDPFLGAKEARVTSSSRYLPSDSDELVDRFGDLGAPYVSAVSDLKDEIDSSGFARRLPHAIGCTGFSTHSGQPTETCMVRNNTAKCCFQLKVKQFEIFQVYPTNEFEVCADLGDGCPKPLDNSDVVEVLRTYYGLTDSQARLRQSQFLISSNEPYVLGIGTRDFDGVDARCKENGGDVEPPVCWLVRERAGNVTDALSCDDIRAAEGTYGGFVEDEFDEDEWADDRVWDCVDAQCVQYECFVVPSWESNDDESARYKSQKELDDSVLEEQIKIRSNQYDSPSRVEVDGDYKTTLNRAEHLFPSWSINITSLRLTKAQMEFTLTSFFRRPGGNDTDYFYVTEPIHEQSVGGREELSLRQSLIKPFALQRSELASAMPSIMHNAFINAMVMDRLSSHEIKVGLRPMPSDNAFDRVNPTSFYQDLLGWGLRLTMPLFSSLLMPIFTYSVVQEKQFKLRSLMKMMGLRISSYWSVEWTFASGLSHSMMFLLWVFGMMSGLRFFRRSSASLLFVSQVWAQLQVAIAFTASVFFWRTKPAILAMYAFIVISCGLGIWLWWESERQDVDRPWRLGYDFIPPFAFFHCVYILTTKGFHLDELFNSNEDFSLAFLLMVLHPLWLYPVAVYLDAVLPRELGASEHALFCLVPIWRRVAALRAGARGVDANDAEAMDATSALNREHVSQMEDSDVTAERVFLERGLQSDSCPVQVFSLRKVFSGGKVGVNNLTLHIDEGQCFGLLGPNGAGKTTTISVLSGLYPPTSGTAFIAGHNLRTAMNKVQMSIGVCPQFDTLWPKLTVRDHMLFYARVRGVPSHLIKKVAEDVAMAVNLGDKLDADVNTLSGGQKRRVSLGIALVGGPAVIFLDEPTTGLDPETKRLMWQLIDETKSSRVDSTLGLTTRSEHKPGRVVILTTHSMDEADALCDRIGIMANGELRCLGSNIHLKNKFGEGYKIMVVHDDGKEKDVHDFVLKVMPKADLLSLSGRSRTYKVRRADVSIRDVFEKMERRTEESGISDWSLRQTSLPQEVLFVRPRMGDATPTQDLDVWRRVVAEGSCSCVSDNEGGTSSGVTLACMSDSVSSGHGLSLTAEVVTADANPSQLQSKLTAGVVHWLLTSSRRAPAAGLGRKAPASQTRSSQEG